MTAVDMTMQLLTPQKVTFRKTFLSERSNTINTVTVQRWRTLGNISDIGHKIENES